MNYKQKYLKYKIKYLKLSMVVHDSHFILKNQNAGANCGRGQRVSHGLKVNIVKYFLATTTKEKSTFMHNVQSKLRTDNVVRHQTTALNSYVCVISDGLIKHVFYWNNPNGLRFSGEEDNTTIHIDFGSHREFLVKIYPFLRSLINDTEFRLDTVRAEIYNNAKRDPNHNAYIPADIKKISDGNPSKYIELVVNRLWLINRIKLTQLGSDTLRAKDIELPVDSELSEAHINDYVQLFNITMEKMFIEGYIVPVEFNYDNYEGTLKWVDSGVRTLKKYDRKAYNLYNQPTNNKVVTLGELYGFRMMNNLGIDILLKTYMGYVLPTPITKPSSPPTQPAPLAVASGGCDFNVFTAK